MLKLVLKKYNTNRYLPRQVAGIILFFLIGFVLSFSSGKLLPLIYLHEAGHSISAKVLGVRLEREDANTFIMYPEEGGRIRDYIRVLRAGYMAECNFWILAVLIAFLVNVRQIREIRKCVHYPAALFPGYTAAVFRELPGSSDMTEIALLSGVHETAAVRNFIIRESIVVFIVIAVYIFVLLKLYRRRNTI